MKTGKKVPPSRKTIPVKNTPHSKKKNDFNKPFFDFLEKYSIYLLPALLLLLIIAVFRDYLAFKYLYLFKDIGSDSINLAYPRIFHLCEYMRTEGIPSWSHYQGMGQSIFPFSLNNPFEWMLFLGGAKLFPYLMAYMEVIKVFLGGWLFFYYLKLMGVKRYIALAGALFYAFTGFMILGSGWNIFSTEAVYLVILLIAFEKLYRSNQWLLFPFSIALLGALQPFDLYLYGLFIVIYAFVRILDDNKKLRDYIMTYLKMALCGMLGLGISAVFVLTELDQVAESPRVGGDASYSHVLQSQPVLKTSPAAELAANILRFYSSDLTGTGSNFKGTQNYLEAPIFYCGLINLLLFTQFFALFSKKKKIVAGILMFVLAVPLIFPWFRYAFWLFTGDYYRTYSFFVAVFILMTSVMSMNEITEKNKINLPLLGATFLLLMAGLFYSSGTTTGSSINIGLRMWVMTGLVIYGIAAYLLSKEKHRMAAVVIILVVSCIELGAFSGITVNKRQAISGAEWKDRTGYNDYTIEAADLINSTDKSFFRVIKDYPSGPAIHASLNDGKIQHFRSTLSYNPFNQKYYIEFLQENNIIEKGNENSSRWATGLINRPGLAQFASHKYYLTRDSLPRDNINRFLYRKTGRTEDVNIFRNQYFLPLGFTYEKYMLINDFFSVKSAIRDFLYLRAFIIPDSLASKLTGLERFVPTASDSFYTVDMFIKDYAEVKTDTLQMTRFDNRSLSGSITLRKKKLLFFSIPYDKGWTATVDGIKVKPLRVNIGFMGLPLDPGKHEITLEYKQPYLAAGTNISAASLLLYALLSLLFFFRKRQQKVRKD